MTTKLKNLIEHIFTKKNIKIFLLLFVLLGFFVGSSFAADSSAQTSTKLEDLLKGINYLLSLLSRGWVVLAVLAGKLMTNDLVYGAFINMDRVLWNLRNIMKNFANFALGFYFIFSIVKTLFSSVSGKSGGSPMKTAIGVVKKTLIAGVLVQMSRFLVGAAIDVSTVATSAVASLPAQFVSSSTDFRGNVGRIIKNGQAITVDLQSNSVSSISTGDLSDDEVNRILDTIMPSADSLVGPFIFIGVSIFDIVQLSDDNRKSTTIAGEIKDLLLDLGVSGFVILTFCIMLALIALFNLFRVLTLWIIIPTIPLIIVLHFLTDGKGLGKGGSDGLKSFTSIKNIFALIFKPVYMVLVLSIVLIVLSIIKGRIINHQTINYDNIYIKQTVQQSQDGVVNYYNSDIDVAGVVNFTLNGVKYSVVDFIVYIFGLLLMFLLMKSCFSKNITGIKFIDEKLNNLSAGIWGKSGEFGGLLGTAGIIPIGGGMVGLGTLGSAVKNSMEDSNSLAKGVLGRDFISNQNDSISKRLGWNKNPYAGISTSLSGKEWIRQAISIGKRNGYNSLDNFRRDTDLLNAIEEYNKLKKDRNDQINPTSDITPDLWNGKETSSTPQNNDDNENENQNQNQS